MTTTPYTPAARQLMEAVSSDMQRILRQTMAGHAHLDGSGDAIMEGTLFAFCAIAFDSKPAAVSGEDLVRMIADQAGRYITSFDAEAAMGPAQGSA